MSLFIIFSVFEAIFDFSYTGKSQNKTLEPGYYKFEVWGAQGGGSAYTQSGQGGKGGYSVGYLNLAETTTIYIQVGGVGKAAVYRLAEGGYNGGGCAWSSDYGDPGHGGGGGTDIRINEDDIYSRVIVAGGGGGGGEDNEMGGYGGGLTGGGNSAGNNYPGTQTSSSSGGAFFQGAHTAWDGGGGGGGTQGGSQTKPTGNSEGDSNGGSGGSGYVYTESTAKNYPIECKLTPKYYLTEASTTAGNQQITKPDGTTSTGHSGNGFARITVIDADFNYLILDNELSVNGFGNRCANVVVIKTVLTGKNIISIANNAFKDQSCITEVKIPETIRKIGSSAFENCENLVNVSFITSSSLISIGDSAFKMCSKLNSICDLSKVTSLGEYCFQGCSSLQSLSIPQVTSLSNSLFRDCTGLTSLNLSENLISIGTSAFQNTTFSIFNISYLNKIESISSSAFKDCFNLEEAYIPQELDSIGDNAFENCESLRYVNLPFNLKSLGKFCFSGCRNLQQIYIPYSLINIKNYAFGSSGIETVLIHSDAVVDGYAFYNCTFLKRVEIFDNAIVMPNGFSNCTNIQKVVVYDYVTLFNNSFDTISSSVFYFGTTDVCYPNTAEELARINSTEIYVRNEYPSDKFCEIQIVKCTSDSVSSSKCLNTPYYNDMQRLVLRARRRR
ncbi:surface antigen BspA-like [Trichomonas vaginalis G3]|uniref:receptor protein-tyrosine kinase n=1 Tax=Trichomonas vaginalis (strain ATCC PRA-98 / G3) TaxID=412133 RepID=A2EK36_TRIV3|nr:protein kinase a regulatory subunit binding [Trichomonas vaginalis G3]EAY07020.1 surface antigen BspA-like [Trichomonas vaginalis G3]KAI5488800.1 protein kinase a regulatory subunit binding [Trichomonas vaginalis G3]|eukprot:XP_001319243.1 surface antigen BspA-like [Trichomonas vaginalis G3]